MTRSQQRQAQAHASAIAAALVLAGCVTAPTYGAIGAEARQFGYRNTQNDDGSHTILVVATSAPQAHEFWDRRATEICGSTTFQKNIFRAQRPVVTQTGYASNPYGGGAAYQYDTYGAFVMEGYLRCDTAAIPAAAPTELAAEATPETTPTNATP